MYAACIFNVNVNKSFYLFTPKFKQPEGQKKPQARTKKSIPKSRNNFDLHKLTHSLTSLCGYKLNEHVWYNSQQYQAHFIWTVAAAG